MTKGTDPVVNSSEWRERDCPSCANDDAHPLGERTGCLSARSGLYKMAYQDVVCRVCGLVYNRLVPEESFLNNYYRDHFAVPFNLSNEPPYDVEKRVSILRKHLVSKNSDYVPRIVEIGGGKGEFVKTLQSKGFDAVNSDLLDNGTVDTETPDAIVCYDMLEHLIDPVGWLDWVRENLLFHGRTGTLVLEVPDMERSPSSAFGPQHLTQFTCQSLKRTLDRCGFEVIEIGHHLASRDSGCGVIAKPSLVDHFDPGSQITNSLEIAKTENLYNQWKEGEHAINKRVKTILNDAQLASSQKPIQIAVWPANDISTIIGEELKKAGCPNVQIVDGNKQKTNLFWPGFQTAILEPRGYQSILGTPAYKILILCSPHYNREIHTQIEVWPIQPDEIVDILVAA